MDRLRSIGRCCMQSNWEIILKMIHNIVSYWYIGMMYIYIYIYVVFYWYIAKQSLDILPAKHTKISVFVSVVLAVQGDYLHKYLNIYLVPKHLWNFVANKKKRSAVIIKVMENMALIWKKMSWILTLRIIMSRISLYIYIYILKDFSQDLCYSKIW